MQLKDYEKVEGTNIDFKEELECKKPKSWLKYQHLLIPMEEFYCSV